MGWIGCIHCEKIRHDFVGRTFSLFAPVWPILHRVSCSNKMDQNAPKHYETHQNMSLRSDGVDRVDLLQKIVTQLCGSDAFLAKNSDTTLWDELFHYLHQFSLFCTEFHAVTKWSKMHPNTMKRSKTWRG